MEWKISVIVDGKIVASAVVPSATRDAIWAVMKEARKASGGTLPPFQIDVRHADV
jgi:hypothetical protein